ncbi:MAG: NapC/NirT family cytochrome c [Coriobacteriia bacterium]|nr:NapC/NirT family cytochrome c [Coriobacteriia bacterium]
MAVVAKDKTAGLDKARPSKTKYMRLLTGLGVVVALCAVGLGAWTYTSTPGLCGSCHEISPAVDGWRDSAHAEEAECMDCHADAGLPGEFVAHIGGIEEAYVHLTQGPETSDIRGTVPVARCLACHEKDWAELPKDHPTKDAPCGVCHRDSAHTNANPLFVNEKGGE